MFFIFPLARGAAEEGELIFKRPFKARRLDFGEQSYRVVIEDDLIRIFTLIAFD